MPMRVEIVAEDRLVYEGEADIVVVPGINGEMGILPNHAPLISTMGFGILKVRTQGEEEVFTVSGGIVEVQPSIVTVLASAAENVMEIDVSRAEEAKERALEIMKEGPPQDTDTYLALEAALRRSNLRLDAVRRYRKYPPQRQSPGTSSGSGE